MASDSFISYRTCIIVDDLVNVPMFNDDGDEIPSNKWTTEQKYLILDTVESKNINATTTVVSQPLQNGDTMTDHMYRNPTQVTISGMFGLYGRYQNDETYNTEFEGNNGADRITAIENVFEYIMNNGLKCTIINMLMGDKIDKSILYDSQGNPVANATRFKRRDNMVLTSISWDEKYDSIKYNFTFKEVISVEVDEPINISRAELGLPSIQYPTSVGIGTIMTQGSKDGVVKTIIRCLKDNGYMYYTYFKWAQDVGEDTFDSIFWSTIGGVILTCVVSVGIALAILLPAVATAVAVTAASAAITGAAITAGSVAAAVPVGTIIVAVIAAVAVLVIGLIAIFKNAKERNIERRNKKNNYKNCYRALSSAEGKQESNELLQLCNKCIKNMNEVNSGISVFSLSDMDDGIDSVQTVLSVGSGEYYYITIEKNQNSKSYQDKFNWKVYNAATFDNKDSLPPEQMYYKISNNPMIVEDFTGLYESNDKNSQLAYDAIWFSSGIDSNYEYKVYIINPSLSAQFQKEYTSDEGAVTRCIENCANYLSSYTIWVSKGNIGKNLKTVSQAVVDAMVQNGIEVND